jgi:hypothetical protein
VDPRAGTIKTYMSILKNNALIRFPGQEWHHHQAEQQWTFKCGNKIKLQFQYRNIKKLTLLGFVKTKI